MQNQPDPDTPVHERRWLDRLRAAWDQVRARPENKAKAASLEAVAQERPEEAGYRIETFAADAALRMSSTPSGRKEEGVEPTRDDPKRPLGQPPSETDRFDDKAGR